MLALISFVCYLFCSGHRFACCFAEQTFCGNKVDREFIEDSFNLYGLRALVPHYNEALDMILDVERMDEAPSEERQVSKTS